MSGPQVTGLDLSLSASGVAVMSVNEWGDARVSQRLIETEPFPKGYEPRLDEWVARQTQVVHAIVPLVPEGGLVVIEAGSYNSRFGNPHERAGLFWRITQYLVRRGDAVAKVAPKTRAKYAAGSGSADKKQVVDEVAASMPFTHVRDHNIADALALAAMGWRWLGRPVDTSSAVLERKKNEAVRAVRWPEARKGMWT